MFILLFLTLNTRLSTAQQNSVFYEAEKLKKDDPSYLSALNNWNQYQGSAIFPPQINDKEYNILISKSIFTLLNNRQSATGSLKHEGIFPSYNGFPGFWAWDSWKHAFALAAIEPELAKNCIRAMYDYQDTCGMIADCIFIDPSENNYRDTKPPLSGWAIAKIFKETWDSAFVREMLPGLTRYHEWWYTHRDHDKNGLCEYGSTDGTIQAARWESGWDNAVRFDSAVMVQNNSHAWSMSQESADLNSYLYCEKICLSYLYEITGQKDRADQYLQAANNLASVIKRAMWDETTGFFYDIDLFTKQPIKVPEPNGWIPLWAGIATPEQARRIRDHILNPLEFNTFVPLPTVAANNPSFNPGKGYWRGPVWLDQACFAILGLRRYGYNNDADTLLVKLFKNCEGLLDPNSPIRENYHPLTGKGLNAEHFSWSAAHILILLADY